MNLDLEQWQFYGAAAAALAFGAHTKWTTYKTKKAAQRVETTLGQSPMSNGFAKKVTEALSRIEDNQARTERKIDNHLAAHADAHVHSGPGRIKRELTEL
jgi:hypothetical protein